MESILVFMVGFVTAWVTFRVTQGARAQVAKTESVADPLPLESKSEPMSSAMLKLAQDLDDFFQSTSHPRDLLQNRDFDRGAERLASAPVADVLSFVLGENNFLNCLGLEALARHADGPGSQTQVQDHVPHFYAWQLFFVFRYLKTCPSSNRFVAVLKNCQPWWPNPPFLPAMMNEFLVHCREQGESLSLAQVLPEMESDGLDALQQVLQRMPEESTTGLRQELKAHLESRVDVSLLSRIGRLISRQENPEWLAPFTVANGARLESLVFGDSPRSVLVCGEPGVGKSKAIDALVQKWLDQGWHFFELSARDMIAGQSYIGELEQRINDLAEKATLTRKVVWILPNVHEFQFTGRHKHNPSGVLEQILPLIEAGKILVIGETTSSAYERLWRNLPKIQHVFQVCQLIPPDKSQVVDALPHMLAHLSDDRVRLSSDATQELLELSSQFLADQALPGQAWQLLKRCVQRVDHRRSSAYSIKTPDLLETLSEITGLPVTFLSEGESLVPDDIHAFFDNRIKGQDEAVQTLVDRIAMIKAGLTDPTRPFGVFLFVGPTGSGKTEIAKALAEFLFGSPQRMIRLDMSEFQNAGSLDRILGGTEEFDHRVSLTSQIRKQPFSVVLLDEFEKAHARVWDLFLQVFDDGRLTDATGHTVDFRYTILIMTSNLGATIPHGSSIGFGSADRGFSKFQVEKALKTTFRREFVNRIDKIVVFHPLSRTVMRHILEIELARAFERRGFRGRPWAVEVEPGAYDFLLDRGFTADLGARPLKRAIEQHLLAPLARTMVTERIEGDQFLLVHADGNQLNVTFVDPDAAAPVDEQLAAESVDLLGMAWEPRPSQANLDMAHQKIAQLEHVLKQPSWLALKQHVVEAMNHAAFWSDPNRFAQLGRFEIMDRIAFSLKGMGSLLNRLRPGSVGSGVAVRRLALTLWHLELAIADVLQRRPTDAFVRARKESDSDGGSTWLGKLIHMYESWSSQRGMKWTLLEQGPSQVTVAIKGFGAYSALASESGVHVWEEPMGDRAFHQERLLVQVWGHPELPLESAAAMLEWLSDQQCHEVDKVVRTYRELPSPLVRDHVLGYRSGKLNRILNGEFNLVRSREKGTSKGDSR